jgi:hypothetical protein
MPPSNHQINSAGQELLTAARLTASGLGQLQAMFSRDSDFYFLPVLAIHSGLERWLKITICYRRLATSGAFPLPGEFPRSNQGHNLVPLLQKVVKECYPPGAVSSNRYFKDDKKFLNSEPAMRFARALSEFGLSSRYYHLNVVLGELPSYVDPERAWEDMVSSTMDEDPDLAQKFLESGYADEHLMTALNRSVAVIARIARALARLAELDVLGSSAKQYSGPVFYFSKLDDQELASNSFPQFAKDLF